jgi:glycosyltransferase involved in cell wall biosynthesis
MAMGIPIICNTNVGDTDKIVNDYDSGIIINDFSVSSYQNAIDKMASEFDAPKIMEGAKDYFSLESGVEKYAAIYHAVLS